jgi:hypothetical protein
MSNVNFTEYIEGLKAKVVELSEKIENIIKSKAELWASLEIEKNQIKKEASLENADYKPQSLNLGSFKLSNLKLQEDNFIQILNKIYKI